MTALAKEERITTTLRIEVLLSENCRNCKEAKIPNKTWTSICEKCPVLSELQELGKSLDDAVTPEDEEKLKLRALAKKNGINLNVYHSRIVRGIDPLAAATMPVKSRK